MYPGSFILEATDSMCFKWLDYSLAGIKVVFKLPNHICAVLRLVAWLCPTLCDPMDGKSSGSSVHRNSPGQNAGVDCHVLLQGIYPTDGLNPGLPHCRWILYQLSYQGSPHIYIDANMNLT